MRPRESLRWCDPDQSGKWGQLGRQSEGTNPPKPRVIGQRCVGTSTRQKRLADLLVSYISQPAIPQHRIDSIGGRCDRRRHALESRKISQRVQHH
jgi:hypothetical protein